MAKAASRNSRPDPLDTPPARSIESMEHADGASGGPQVIAAPVCEHCGSTAVKIVSSQGVRVSGKRWQRQRYRCDDAKCEGRKSLTVVMRGPFGVTVAGDKDAAAKVKPDRKTKAQSRSSIAFAGS